MPAFSILFFPIFFSKYLQQKTKSSATAYFIKNKLIASVN